jgi:hypothetical protein
MMMMMITIAAWTMAPPLKSENVRFDGGRIHFLGIFDETGRDRSPAGDGKVVIRVDPISLVNWLRADLRFLLARFMDISYRHE